MEQEREGGATPDATREWLLQLEQRVSELERAAAQQARQRQRSLLFMLLAGLVYVVVVYLEVRQSLP